MKRYDEEILGHLVDSYEKSLVYSGKNKGTRGIVFSIQKKTLPEYFDESGMQFDTIHQQLEQLEQQGYIKLVWKHQKRGHILEKCELVMERVEDIYQRLQRKPKRAKEQEILEICDVYVGKVPELDHFLEWVRLRIQEDASVRRYVDLDDPGQFRQLCELIFRMLANEKECFLRQFSIQHFQDSKLAEKDLMRAVRVIADFSSEMRFANLEDEEILAECNLYRNPSWLMMKGNVGFSKICGERMDEIELSSFVGGIGISNQDLETIRWNPMCQIEKVITVENLTSFHQWNARGDRSVLCIYLGGYHNHVKREFLKTLYVAYPDAEYLHFGDIDCGGFRIWKDLCVKTGIPFKTLFMDLATYHKYLAWGRSLTEQDRKTLLVMMKDSFFEEQTELFAHMMEQGIKLEQECVEVGALNGGHTYHANGHDVWFGKCAKCQGGRP